MIQSHIFPIGSYFIGDPCHIFNDLNWQKYFHYVFNFAGEQFQYQEKLCFAQHTVYGAGDYLDNENHIYFVDSGVLGITPIEIIDDIHTLDVLNSLGKVVEFKTPFKVSCSPNCTFQFDDIIIHTD